ncbi:MAG: hypothetical protein JNK58_10890 [Phycisphaerae bacterium]|nr:hypothetical protein [Phycisphaerae bacterium]
MRHAPPRPDHASTNRIRRFLGRSRRFISFVTALLLFPMLLAASPADQPAVPNLRARLAALDGSDPLPYFLLAEEVASEMRDHKGLALARTLFVLAHEIDRASPHPEGLARSVYLALASIAENEDERDWLLALAGSPPPTIADQANTATLITDALSAARAGDGRSAAQLLDDPSAAAALDRLRRSDPIALDLLLSARDKPSCPICANRRLIKSKAPHPAEGREDPDLVCPECRGNPGPRLTADQYTATIAASSMLLGARHETWSAQAWLDRGAPLRDPTPSELAPYFEVDPQALRWQPELESSNPADGTWTRVGPLN